MSNQTFGPYSPVRKAGDFYFVSGQVGVRPDRTFGTTISEQTDQALKNLRAVLDTVDLDLPHVVKITIFLTNIDDFGIVNAICETFFDPPRPARSTLEVAALPKVADKTKLLVEIEAVAYRETD